MSWKLFFQIVLLLIVGGLVLASLKIGIMNYRYEQKAEYWQTKPARGRQQVSPGKDPHKYK